jgi:uncharacterized protein DUF4055
MAASGSLDTKHPKYTQHIEDWKLCRDCKRGERIIKEAMAKYLPPTSAMIADGMNVDAKGWCDYQIYLSRAVFHGFTERAIDRYMGQLWEKAPKIELPPKMEPLRERCNRKGESLMQLLRLMQDEALSTSRLGLFADMPQGIPLKDPDGNKVGTQPLKGDILPYVNMYKAENIINWDEGDTDQVVHESLNLVVLDESGPTRKTIFEWEDVKKWRVLMLGDAQRNEEDAPTAGGSAPIYKVGLFTDQEIFDESKMIEPSWHGNKLNHIPFVFINSKDIVPEPDDPALLNLARKDITIYRGEADYRQTLFMQGQYVFVISGEVEEDASNPKPVRTGAGSLLRLSNPQAKAQYVGIEGQGGLSEQREAIQNDIREADVLAGSLTDNRSNEKESGDAMGKRMAGTTASLRSIALSCALGLQTILRSIATWMGEDPEAVVITPNLEFSETKLAPKDILDLQTMKTGGGPISDEAIHYNIKRSGLTPFEYEDETDKIAEEEPRVDLSGGLVGAPLDPATEADVELKQDAHEHGKKMSEEQLKLAKNADKREAKKPPAKK